MPHNLDSRACPHAADGSTRPFYLEATEKAREAGALDRPLTLTLFPDAFATRKAEVALTPRQLARRIGATTADRKEGLPFLKLARFGDKRTVRDSLRHDANVLAVSGVEADYDGGETPVDDACEILEKKGLAAIVYTSPSHTEDAPRWRVLCPLSTELAPERRAHQLGRLNGLFRGALAPESFTLSQSYYFGTVRGNPSHRVELIDGSPIDEHDDLDEVWVGTPGKRAGADAGFEASGDAREDAELVRRVVTGAGYHGELRALAARYVGRGMGAGAVAGVLQGLMLARPDASRDARWRGRFADIDRLVAGAVAKYAGAREAREALARLARRRIDEGWSAEDIRRAMREEARRRGLDPTAGVAIAQRVAAQVMRRIREAGNA